MKISRIAAAVALTGSLFASQAMAATICANCSYNGDSFLGLHNAVTNDGSGFRHDGMAFDSLVAANNNLTDRWFFDLTPIGVGQVNANFIPFAPLGISGFTIDLYKVTPGAGFSCTAVTNVFAGPPRIDAPGKCTGTIDTLTLMGSATAGPGDDDTGLARVLDAATYMIQVTGELQNVPGTIEYSGQLRVAKIPEPATLGLVGVALLAAAGSLRRSRKV